MLNTGKERFPQKRTPQERGGFNAYCPSCRRVLYKDEVRQMKVPPFREVCNWCGGFVNKNLDSGVFGS